MASGSYIQAYIKCPFYAGDNGKNRILCEGIIPGSQLHSVFRDMKDYEIQTREFCCKRYRNCEIYIALMQKYEED